MSDVTMTEDQFDAARQAFAEAYTSEFRAKLEDLQRRYDGCIAINREQVGRLARAENALEMARTKNDLQRDTIAKQQARIAELETPKP